MGAFAIRLFAPPRPFDVVFGILDQEFLDVTFWRPAQQVPGPTFFLLPAQDEVHASPVLDEDFWVVAPPSSAPPPILPPLGELEAFVVSMVDEYLWIVALPPPAATTTLLAPPVDDELHASPVLDDEPWVQSAAPAAVAGISVVFSEPDEGFSGEHVDEDYFWQGLFRPPEGTVINTFGGDLKADEVPPVSRRFYPFWYWQAKDFIAGREFPMWYWPLKLDYVLG